MSRKSVIILATALLILAATVVASGGYLRRQILAMHGAAPSEPRASKGRGSLREAAAAATHDAIRAVHGSTAPVPEGNHSEANAVATPAHAVTERNAAGAAPSAPAASPRPAPLLGDRAHGWMTAFSAGEDAMREFITRNFAPEALEKRDVDERMKGYEKLHDRFGTLKPGKILGSEPGEIEALLIAEDGSEHEFIFTGQEKAPFKLLSIAYRDVQHGH